MLAGMDGGEDLDDLSVTFRVFDPDDRVRTRGKSRSCRHLRASSRRHSFPWDRVRMEDLELPQYRMPAHFSRSRVTDHDRLALHHGAGDDPYSAPPPHGLH